MTCGRDGSGSAGGWQDARGWLTDAIRARLDEQGWQETLGEIRSFIGPISEAEVEARIGEYRKDHSSRGGDSNRAAGHQ
jgi:hypothetical protein